MLRRIRFIFLVVLTAAAISVLGFVGSASAWDPNRPIPIADCSPGAATSKWEPCMAFITAGYGAQVIRFGHGGPRGWGVQHIRERRGYNATTRLAIRYVLKYGRLVSHNGTTDNWEGEVPGHKNWRVAYSTRIAPEDPYHEQVGVVTAFRRSR